MFGLKAEFTRNFTAFVLLALGSALVYRGEAKHLPEVVKLGGGFGGAALLAFQRKTEEKQ